MGALAGIEMSLDIAKMPHRAGGVAAAMEVLRGRDGAPMLKAVVA
jgi:alanine-glyoxylate transaminase/serine-glyoxylate transaminase/serine-pyruvate transaminase